MSFARLAELFAVRTRLKCILASALAVVLLSTLLDMPGIAAAPHSPAVALGDHYLLLVNTAIASLLKPDDLREFDKSAYNGIAVAFAHAYETGAVPTVAQINQQIADYKKLTTKQIWPWVYLNRAVGFNAEEKNHYANNPYFQRVAGFDLEGKSGNRQEFLLLWRNSLQAARESGMPGIFADLEFYNNNQAYDIGVLSKQYGKKPEEVKALLMNLGMEMADIAAVAFPEANLWFAFSGLTFPEFKTYEGRAYFPSPAYVMMGMLDEIVKKQYSVRVITGGEGSLAYCSQSLQHLQQKIAARAAKLAPFVEKYHGAFELGGTMGMWDNRIRNTGWAAEGDCRTVSATTAEDLQPYLELLMRTYRYNWIYATSEENYLPFATENAMRFNTVIKAAQSNTKAKPQ